MRASCVHASTESYTQTCVNDSGGSPMHEASFNLFLGFPSVIAASIGIAMPHPSRRRIGERNLVLSDQRGSAGQRLIDPRDEPQIPRKAAQLVPLFQLVTRGHPAGGDDVCTIPAVSAKC